jgi:hypothetical protein
MSLVFQNIDPPPPSPPGECVLPPPKAGGTHSPGGGGMGVNILEDERHRIALLQYCNNLSTIHTQGKLKSSWLATLVLVCFSTQAFSNPIFVTLADMLPYLAV